MQKQLALFDIDSAVAPSLEPGDWVKLRRKSTSAAYWKKGEVVQIESVNPHTGCTRFWNERAETWGYLHPDDIIPVPPPLDSVSVQPIALDTESTAPPLIQNQPPRPLIQNQPPRPLIQNQHPSLLNLILYQGPSPLIGLKVLPEAANISDLVTAPGER